VSSAATDTGRPRFLDQSGHRLKIFPEEPQGRFIRWRRWVYAVLLLHLLALPFIRNGKHPAIHLDIPGRHFYIAGQAFNAQDAWLIFLVLVTVAFGLVFLTSLAGRVWCGWACPQTVFLEGVYRRIERWIEGNADARRRLAAGPWTDKRIALFILKQAAFLTVSLLLAHWVLAFFVPMSELPGIVLHVPLAHPQLFVWAMAFTAAFMFNFGWFREQTCIIVCPYGRFQSVLTDQQSLLIGYDTARGEPRHKGRAEPGVVSTAAAGDCIDCGKCVRVCPTGIDIRNGQQLECIGCAQCIDACDSIMDKLQRPRGLVRYDSLAGFAKETKRILRPRLFIYAALSLTAACALVVDVARVRTAFEANLLRAGGTPYVLDQGTIRDQFELHLINKHPEPADFELAVHAPDGAEVVVAQDKFHLDSMQSVRAPIFVSVDKGKWKGPFAFEVELKDRTDGRTRENIGRFIGPPSM